VETSDDFFPEERQGLLLNLLRANGKVLIQDASAQFGVSVDTIRRDLNQLVRAGFAHRTHGGAMLKAKVLNLLPRNCTRSDPKSSLGKMAARLVKPNSVIIFDSGRTCVQVAKNIPAKVAFTAVTSNLAVAEALARRPGTTVIIATGRVLKSSRSIVGAEVVRLLQSVRADLCFLGACCIGPETGVGAIELEELPIKQQMIESASRVIAVASGEKFNATATYSVCPLNTLDAIITDQKPPKSILERFEALEVETATP
jgi:DeoR/GlpR family transcriptional regulator of sugar metabolism